MKKKKGEVYEAENQKLGYLHFSSILSFIGAFVQSCQVVC